MGVRAFPMPTTADHLDKEDICPKRFGLTYDPPAIVLEYLQTSTGKLFHRKIGLKRLKPGTDASRVAEKMRQKNEALLAEDKVSFEQLVSLVKRLQETLASAEQKSEVLSAEVDYQVTDLNKLSPEEVALHKAKMDEVFFKNQKKPGDQGFVYDVQVDFQTEGAPASGWDSEEDDMDADT